MIFVPYASEVSVATRCALIGYEWEAVDVGGDSLAYGRWLGDRWAARQTFVNVEHDVVPWPGAIESLLGCDEPWCAFNYHLPCHRSAGIGTAGPLGCVKLGAALMDATPGMWDEPCRWDMCDLRLRDVATSPPVSLRVHEHHPGVVHANPALVRGDPVPFRPMTS